MNNSPEIQHLLLLLDDTAPSFCYYNSHKKEQSKSMPYEILKKGVDFARIHSLGLHIIYGEKILPPSYKRLLDSVAHIRIVPYYKDREYEENDIVVWEPSDDIQPNFIQLNQPVGHLILRIPIDRISCLYTFIESNFRKLKRLSVIFKDIAYADETRLNAIRLSFERLQPLLLPILFYKEPTEIGFASDRILLKEMNNCNAGVTHLTLAPNGNFYICPGFYYDHSSPVGTLDNGIDIPNKQLYRYENAPICKKCDCYQCKRCIYLNQLLTREVNTPSHNQCVLSHHERNLSGILLQKLHQKNHFKNVPAIPPLFYLDPIDIVDTWEFLF